MIQESIELPVNKIKNPLLSIWLSPKKTFTHVLNQHPGAAIYILAALFGIIRVLDQASKRGLGDHMGFIGVFVIAILLGSISGIIGMGIFGGIISLVSKWLGGSADGESLRVVYAWSSLPAIISFLLVLPFILIFHKTWFLSNSDWMSTPIALLILLIGLILVPFRIWQFVLLVIGVKEANQFSVWRAIGALVLPLAVIGVPMLLIAVLILLRA